MNSLAKTTVPSLANPYPRQRLFSQLLQAAAMPLIWVYGPPGAGKTTLIASYLAHCNRKPLWYRCDEGDADPATLFYYLGLAGKAAVPRTTTDLPLFTAEYRQGLQSFTRRYFQDLYASLEPPFSIVFDNFQDAGTGGAIHELMQSALEEIPPQGQVIILSRVEPPIELARLRANGQMLVIGPGALRLTPEEVEGLALSRGVSLRDGQQAASVDELQGWAAGLVLLCASEEAGLQSRTSVGLQRPQAVFDYFAGEILRKTDAKTHHILLCAALSPMVTISQAQEASGDLDASVVLQHFYRNNYFLARDSQPDPVYQFHPLFRVFLLAKAQAAWSQEQLSTTRNALAMSLAKHGQIEAAIELWRESKNWEALAVALDAAAPKLVRQGRHGQLSAWLHDVPEALLQYRPWLLFWRGTVSLAVNPMAGYPDLQQAFDLFRSQKVVTGMYRSWAAIAAAIRNDSTGDYARLDYWMDVLEEITAAHPVFSSEELEWYVAYSMFANAYFRAPKDPRLTLWKARGMLIARARGNAGHQVTLLCVSVLQNLLCGDIAEAGLDVAQIRSLESAIKRNPVLMNQMHWSVAYYHQCIGDFDAAMRHTDAALTLSRYTGATIWNYQSYARGIDAALSCGDLQRADVLLADMGAESRVDNGFAGMYYHVQVVWRSLLAGDLVKAMRHAEVAVAMRSTTNIVLLEWLARYGLALTHHFQGDADAARRALAGALEQAREIDSPILGHMSKMLASDIEFSDGRIEPGLQALREGLALGRQQQFISFHFWMPDIMARGCARALEAGMEADYARHIIRCRKLRPPSVNLVNWPWRLRITTLGNFSLMQDDRPLEFGRKAPKKLIVLLKALIAMGGRDVNESTLADNLWCDLNGDKARQALATALKRLRKLVGEDVILIQGGRISLDPQQVWVDAWTFEGLLNETAGLAYTPGPRIAEALELYRGAFLATDDDTPWTVSMGERLRVKFIQQTIAFGRHLFDTGQADVAIRHLLRGLEADPLAEALYQQLMQCYAALGRKAEGLAVYRRLRQTLSITLGIAPSATSDILHQRLCSGD